MIWLDWLLRRDTERREKAARLAEIQRQSDATLARARAATLRLERERRLRRALDDVARGLRGHE